MIKKNISFYIRFIFVVTISILLIYFVEFKKLSEHLTTKILTGIIFCQIPLFLGIIPIGIRLAVFIGKPYTKFTQAAKAVILSSGFNFFLPWRISELIKPFFLYLKANIPISEGLSAVFLERITDIIIITCFALTILWVNYVNLNLLSILFTLIFLITLLTLIGLAEKHILKMLLLIPFKRLKLFLSKIISHIALNLRNGIIFKGFFWGIVGWLCSFSGLVIFMTLSGSIPLNLFQCMLLFIATSIAYAIPALPGGIGSYEAGAVIVLKQFNYGVEEALVLSIGLHLSQLISILFLTSIILIKDDLKLSSIIRDVRRYLNSKKDL
jgi:uncharacterized membrane protein YbhN (UPF0104 family)